MIFKDLKMFEAFPGLCWSSQNKLENRVGEEYKSRDRYNIGWVNNLVC